ncbi:hypothetical protein THAOC_22391 [Thalassiosira oceanica]|uniref:Uncharacterized protein n=1 Tax=Thalassiosira oceanica TaxID=159749 RepID=K0SG29_THAOC|nr:hypothetical protein THAOC_22391 [Thalassiosira oceanica]|eukprot:EJK57552.1 hypothetical protein THAOC_22391 [Thalassiosira oceanica]
MSHPGCTPGGSPAQQMSWEAWPRVPYSRTIYDPQTTPSGVLHLLNHDRGDGAHEQKHYWIPNRHCSSLAASIAKCVGDGAQFKFSPFQTHTSWPRFRPQMRLEPSPFPPSRTLRISPTKIPPPPPPPPAGGAPQSAAPSALKPSALFTGTAPPPPVQPPPGFASQPVNTPSTTSSQGAQFFMTPEQQAQWMTLHTQGMAMQNQSTEAMIKYLKELTTTTSSAGKKETLIPFPKWDGKRETEQQFLTRLALYTRQAYYLCRRELQR